jgi:hypothetical protein
MPNKRPRGPQPHWRPKRETLRVLAAVEVVLDRYRDHLPVSLRQLFYVLLSDGVLAKTECEYKRMCEYVGMARRSGRIAWDAIRDDTQIAVEAPASFWRPRRLLDGRGDGGQRLPGRSPGRPTHPAGAVVRDGRYGPPRVQPKYAPKTHTQMILIEMHRNGQWRYQAVHQGPYRR